MIATRFSNGTPTASGVSSIGRGSRHGTAWLLATLTELEPSSLYIYLARRAAWGDIWQDLPRSSRVASTLDTLNQQRSRSKRNRLFVFKGDTCIPDFLHPTHGEYTCVRTIYKIHASDYRSCATYRLPTQQLRVGSVRERGPWYHGLLFLFGIAAWTFSFNGALYTGLNIFVNM